MKSKGLQRLRWYCQVCEKQCRDENGFKCHAMSEGHLRQMLVVGESAGRHIADYSQQFKVEFLLLLSRRWGTKRVKSNTVYQEYISDKNHIHMNATRWVTLTEFCKYLGREGIAHVDETEKGWFISWVDNSPKALAKQAAAQKKERMDMDDEEKERRLIEEQIQRAKVTEEDKDKGEGSSSEAEEKDKDAGDFKREEGQVIKLGFPKPKPEVSNDSENSGNPSDNSSAKPIGISLAAPVAKPKNIFKTMKSSSASSKSTSSAPLTNAPVKLSAMEQIIQEDIERKRKRDESGWSERGYGRSGLQVSDREPKRQRVY